MGILSENDMYLKAAERAFYRNPFSDLLIISFSALNNDDDRWKGLQLPVLLVPDKGDIPGATRREIARRKRVNLFVWGHPEAISDETLDELATITRGKVYRVLAHGIKKEAIIAAEEDISTTEGGENLPAPIEEKVNNSAAENYQGEKEKETGGTISVAQDNVLAEPQLAEETAENVKWPTDVPGIHQGQPDQEDNQVQGAPTTAEDKTTPPEYTHEASPEINENANTQAPVEEGFATGNDDVLPASEEGFTAPEELINALMANLPQEVITLEEATQEEIADEDDTQEVAVQEEGPPEEGFPEETWEENEVVVQEQVPEVAPGEETPPYDPADEIKAEDEKAWETAKTEDTAGKNIIVWRFPK